MTGPSETKEPILDDPEPEPILDSRVIPPKLLPLWMVLADGNGYSSKKLMLLAGIESRETLRGYLWRLRKFLRPRGLDVMLRFMHNHVQYQLVRLLNKGE